MNLKLKFNTVHVPSLSFSFVYDLCVSYCRHILFCDIVKFIYSEKATKFCEIFTLLLTGTTLISLITVEVGINVEGRRKLPNH